MFSSIPIFIISSSTVNVSNPAEQIVLMISMQARHNYCEDKMTEVTINLMSLTQLNSLFIVEECNPIHASYEFSSTKILLRHCLGGFRRQKDSMLQNPDRSEGSIRVPRSLTNKPSKQHLSSLYHNNIIVLYGNLQAVNL